MNEKINVHMFEFLGSDKPEFVFECLQKEPIDRSTINTPAFCPEFAHIAHNACANREKIRFFAM